ncbi:MAG: UDP-N-acetylglucosamine 2-epimerase (non-hydrolyzing) [Ignavibacteriales bacterium UTCHB2]|jgi:UDP-N-acetylglucosamine 2-epimerase (non-hydrolysing)|nr:MAG: UDP-N-acetylglucosamine 2-epimerase (non-hydrolyzing) [Ignavibacteriales bacterium UTCHB2]HQI42398.1 UDP-N-acetylglucosamine 2-epimerase (non-hydrolyzing) [Ignavibacteriaceae bacterium]
MKIISVVGARPNFMKVAPFISAIKCYNQQTIKNNTEKINHILVHTGQHYDDLMSKKFFDDLNIPEADINLGIGSGTHAEQVGNSMIELEKVFEKEKPAWVIIYGDVNATLAASVTAKKLHIKVCHIEAGLRSGDMKMPEEINRLVTDRLSDLLLTPDKISVENLKREGIKDSAIRFVGNIMIDTLEKNRQKANKLDINQIVKSNLISNSKEVNITSDNYAVITLHRPSNVDDKNILSSLVNFITTEVSSVLPVIWAIHPRTEKQLKFFSLWNKLIQASNIFLVSPLGYHDMLRLNMDAKIMLTDSGGLQEECTVLGTPCLTMRWNTERPVTLREYGGASVLVGNNVDRIRKEFFNTLKESRKPERPALWDGKTAERCLDEILKFII